MTAGSLKRSKATYLLCIRNASRDRWRWARWRVRDRAIAPESDPRVWHRGQSSLWDTGPCTAPGASWGDLHGSQWTRTVKHGPITANGTRLLACLTYPYRRNRRPKRSLWADELAIDPWPSGPSSVAPTRPHYGSKWWRSSTADCPSIDPALCTWNSIARRSKTGQNQAPPPQSMRTVNDETWCQLPPGDGDDEENQRPRIAIRGSQRVSDK